MELQRIELLGEGVFGKVYLERDVALDRMVAVKYVPLDGLGLTHESFVSEARVLQSCKHPNVIEVFAAEVTDDGFGRIVMEYAQGGTLCGDECGDVRDSIVAIVDACRGVEAIHNAGFLHRDIKPSNLLRGAEGQTKVSDFGLVRGGSSATSKVGYPPHLPPEGVISRAGDVFALATSLYRLLLGTAVYRSQFRVVEKTLDESVAKERFPDRKGYPLHVSPAVRQAVNRAMRADVAKRIQTAAEFRRSLEQVLPDVSWNEVARENDGDSRRWLGVGVQGRRWEATANSISGGWNFEVRSGRAGQLRRSSEHCRKFESLSELESHAKAVFAATATGKRFRAAS